MILKFSTNWSYSLSLIYCVIFLSLILEVQLLSLEFHTNRGQILIQCVWDTARQENFGAIVMVDATYRSNYKNDPNCSSDLVHVCENFPIVLCGKIFAYR